MPVLMFGVMGHTGDHLAHVATALTGTAEMHLAADDQYGGRSCTATPLGLSKWVGVVAYCTAAGLDPNRILAIGDGPNDTELLTAASTRWHLRVRARPRSPPPTTSLVPPHDGGWAEILDLV